MYKRFFEFKEKPFKLVPNPTYLFLSKSHQNALAHLVYAVDAGDGFVELTGEVGTGKTTLCRAFLESLDEHIEVAYIFNPILDAVELIRAVNDEFGIRSDTESVKDLIDALNAFLIEKKTQGKTVILMIDEAQNLNREVLEQIRLISNLETTRSKLLQIILVGQPELRTLLDSHHLRQLRQRITLCCRLEPLTYQETVDYIEHRIRIASHAERGLFTRGAVQKIYRFSRGIPRLINMACDRSLLTAYGLEQKTVSVKAAATAIKELAGRDLPGRSGFWTTRRAAAIAAAFTAVILMAWYVPGLIGKTDPFKPSDPLALKQTLTPVVVPPQPKAVPTAVPELPQKVIPVAAVHEPDAEVRSQISLEMFLNNENLQALRESAVKTILKLWDLNDETTQFLQDTADDDSFFKVAVGQHGLAIFRSKGDLDVVLRLNLPAILPLDTPKGLFPAYLVLAANDNGQLEFKDPKEQKIIRATLPELKARWSGVAYIPWKNFFALRGKIPGDASGESIITLKLLLRDIGFTDMDLSPKYDKKTRATIIQIQARHELSIDGVVGPMTKIALYNEKKSLKIPHLNRKLDVMNGIGN